MSWQSGDVTLYQGDCLEVMAGMEANSIDTCITDPPYGLGFMGKDWDHGVPGIRYWQEVGRVLKPGGMLLAFGGTRTFHRLAVAIEDAGFEIRDTVMWVYGSGFPKSHDIGKAIDKTAGAEREVVGRKVYPDGTVGHVGDRTSGNDGWKRPWQEREKEEWQGKMETAPATLLAEQWDGWGTALKPAWEPIIVAMKPTDGTFAQNAERWGVAGLWIDGARVGTNGEILRENMDRKNKNDGPGSAWSSVEVSSTLHRRTGIWENTQGRWPANLIHDGSSEVLAGFPETTSGAKHGIYNGWGERREIYGSGKPYMHHHEASSGSAARFFYCAKASRAERNAGPEGMPVYKVEDISGGGGFQHEYQSKYQARKSARKNLHPTVKPLALMRYLVRLTRTPTGGVVLDPFMGSGTTGMACVEEGRPFVGIELDADYLEIARRRIEHAGRQLMLL